MRVTLAEIPAFAKKFVASLPVTIGSHAYVVGLNGELGAGKTTFVQAVAHELGAKETPTSPTFVIAQRYAITRAPFTSLIHVDFYRVEPSEIMTIGWREFLAEPTNLILVEWAKKLPGHIPEDAPILSFSSGDVGSREIEYVKK